MPPVLALIIWLVLLLGLLCFDPARERGTSFALWIPLLWMLIIGSRLPSQWLGLQAGIAARALEEGNPLDRSIDLLLILLAFVVLIARGFNWGGFFARNLALMTFLAFALMSVLWSDFPLVSFKRWFRDLGNYLVILVVLSDAYPVEAVRTLLRRLFYLLIPFSILLNKYYPVISKQYDQWTGAAMFVGATTSKNMLGVLCLISGVFFFWDMVARWSDRKEWRTKKILAVDAAFMAMTLWLLNLSNSATSGVCLAVGCLVILAVHSGWGKRHPTFLKVLIPTSFCLYLILAFGFDLNGQLASQVGRDPTLTDRSLIWKTVLSLHTNPVIGTGYESFWLGSRLDRVWQVVGRINEAHNGYIDMYLNLGGFGIALLAAFLIAGYRSIWKRMSSSSGLATLSLAIWTILLFYNMTEAAFKGGLLWLTLLLGAIVVPARAGEQVQEMAAVTQVRATKRLSELPLQTASRRR